MEHKETIMVGMLKAFNEKGLKFTMDDVAKNVGMSKKTIYNVFKDKEAMFFATVEYLFSSIKEGERRIFNDESLNPLEKLRQMLGVLPNWFDDIDFGQVYLLKDKYPTVYHQVVKRLENDWEATIELLEQAEEQGYIRHVNIPIFRTMFTASIERFFEDDILIVNKIPYNTAIKEVISTLIDGIVIREEEKK